MTITVANTNANSTATVSSWRTRTNELATAMSTKVVTVDSNSTTGNAQVNGSFTSFQAYHANLAGGTATAPANLTVITNTNFSGNANFNNHVTLGAGANVHLLVGNATHRIVMANAGGVSGLFGSKILINSDASDVTITSLANNHVLQWSNTSNAWVNRVYNGDANNALLLNGQPNSFYTNASNMATGTLPTGRITGAYTGITSVGTLGTLAVTGNVTMAAGARLGVGNVAPTVTLHITGTDAVFFPTGTTAQRPTGANGMMRYNSQTSEFEGFIAGSWGAIGGSGTYLALSGGTLTGKLTTTASATGNAGLNIPHGVAPSTPANGDFWANSSAAYIHLGSQTKTFVLTTEAQSYTAGKKQTMSPNTTNAGLNLGAVAGDPSSLADGDIWLNSSTNKLRTQINGATANVFMEGTAVTAGRKSKWIPITDFWPRVTAGPAVNQFETTTNKINVVTYDFDATSNEHCQTLLYLPNSWNKGVVTYSYVWSHGNTTTNFGVTFHMQGVSLADSDPLDTAFGTSVAVSDTGGTNNDIWISPESSNVTFAGTPADREGIMIQVYRQPANTNDTLAIDARLHGVIIYYTTNADTD